jgi:hypothetical protein
MLNEETSSRPTLHAGKIGPGTNRPKRLLASSFVDRSCRVRLRRPGAGKQQSTKEVFRGFLFVLAIPLRVVQAHTFGRLGKTREELGAFPVVWIPLNKAAENQGSSEQSDACGI